MLAFPAMFVLRMLRTRVAARARGTVLALAGSHAVLGSTAVTGPRGVAGVGIRNPAGFSNMPTTLR